MKGIDCYILFALLHLVCCCNSISDNNNAFNDKLQQSITDRTNQTTESISHIDDDNVNSSTYSVHDEKSYMAVQENDERDLLFHDKTCPPKGFNALRNFNITEYVSARWYVIRQKPVIYSGEETFCSYAQYTIINRRKRTFCLIPSICRKYNNRIYINVNNRGLRDSVNGSSNGVNITAFVPDPINWQAKVQVSIRIVPGSTNYWIVAAGSFQQAIDGTYQMNIMNNNVTDNMSKTYDWAIISGGMPNVKTSNNKCVAGTLGRYDTRGLWMFARQPIPPIGVIDAVTNITEQLGLDTSVWRSVTHEGCVDY